MKFISFHPKHISGKIIISGSKSESNRALMLQQFVPNLSIKNLSDSDDTQYLKKALNQSNGVIDIGHAGTAMRFLTAYFSVQDGKTTVITGSERMKERPIQVLVDALRQLGANIEYLENDGFPPLRIVGKNLSLNKVELKADVSSQYISALLLIAPFLNNGLELSLVGKITSLPYINMTLHLLNQIGVDTQFIGQEIKVNRYVKHKKITLNIESDWSSASYYYSLLALSSVGSLITLSNFKKNSLQGDSILATMYEQFGVKTEYNLNSIILTKIDYLSKKHVFREDFTTCPDIAQTLVVTCLGLGIAAHLTGLHTLKIKETDRLQALKNELEKFGAKVKIYEESLHLRAVSELNEDVEVLTYNDHRMAMAFAPLVLKVPLKIENREVVSKSYKDFWKDISSLFIK